MNATPTRMPHGPAPSLFAGAPALARRLFAELQAAGSDGVGITRRSYGDGETRAIEIIEAHARAYGLETTRDAAANLVVTLPGRDPDQPAIVTGSHMDSVPQGGNYDGAAGVVAGLVAMISIRRAGIVPLRTIRLLGLRGEESAEFSVPHLGSSALFGQITPGMLALHSSDGQADLATCMARVGADLARVSRGDRLVDPAGIACWLELHIEQGPVLEAQDQAVAVVSAVRGNVRYPSVTCTGQAGHAGAVPRALRHDAVLATCAILSKMETAWESLLEQGHDLVMNAGRCQTDAARHAISRIPEQASFSFEFRSQSEKTLRLFDDLFQQTCRTVAAARGVAVETGPCSTVQPGVMDAGWRERLCAIMVDLGIPPATLPSGAGHDATIFARAGIPSAMLFVRNQHGSHNPCESMEIDDFLTGVEVLLHALLSPPP
ncbi:Zn-dependent hydrolase [Gluconacetobacter tumulicola]|nr:Zn-dependent hydrolase [Gluconacetobacter tumulicola]